MYTEQIVDIQDIKTLLESGMEIEVSSPDGWVSVSRFVDKGEWEEYVLSSNGKSIRCNENHLFQTATGWECARDLVGKEAIYLHEDGKFYQGAVVCTGNTIPIVDIQVEHENHRYYTDGISSHNTGVGKSLMLCDHAASCLRSGYKVLYITCEMAEEKISERIDANLLDVDINCISQLAKSQFLKGIIDFQAKTEGRLVVKEYPTATANAMHFRSLLNELRLKKDFKPDVIFIDYLNICASVRYKPGANVNSYTYIKAIAEELRGLAIEADVPIFTATQSNRQGFSSSDPELGDTSESFGLPATADLFLVMVTSEELDEKNQIMFKQLKNRYNDLAKYRKFLVGINRSKMQLYDLEESAQDGLIDTAQDVRNTREYGDPTEGLGETSWDADKKTTVSSGKKTVGGGKFDSWKF